MLEEVLDGVNHRIFNHVCDVLRNLYALDYDKRNLVVLDSGDHYENKLEFDNCQVSIPGKSEYDFHTTYDESEKGTTVVFILCSIICILSTQSHWEILLILIGKLFQTVLYSSLIRVCMAINACAWLNAQSMGNKDI